ALRAAVGLGASVPQVAVAAKPQRSGSAAQVRQYRENDGRFHFKLVDGEGEVLLQSRHGAVSPADTAALVNALLSSARRADGDTEVFAAALVDCQAKSDVVATVEAARVLAGLLEVDAERRAKAEKKQAKG
ncbi:MAG: hypothetical protein J0L88_12680, partial [Xanthomonadales bacterium]|nr:hypothetical protein [Xanthomonadales bacterium]